jgi:hypothetical protein
MLTFVTRPIRGILGITEREVVETVHETRDIETDILGAVEAIESATAQLDRHVAVIETLATSVDPLRASVDRLTDTMKELVSVLGPISAAEHEAKRMRGFLHRHHHDEPPAAHEPSPAD